jgi:hypothetical protein
MVTYLTSQPFASRFSHAVRPQSAAYFVTKSKARLVAIDVEIEL